MSNRPGDRFEICPLLEERSPRDGGENGAVSIWDARRGDPLFGHTEGLHELTHGFHFPGNPGR